MTATARWDDAARLIEQATRVGTQDPPALMMLALAYKHLGRFAEARQTLGKIAHPDADVFLQRGLLAFQAREFASAAEDFQAALTRDPSSYPAAYNLFLARVWDNKIDLARNALAAAQNLSTSPDDKRFLGLVLTLLHLLPGGASSADAGQVIASLNDDEERRILELFTGLGRFEVAYPVLSRLVASRPSSSRAFGEFFAAVLVQAKQFLDKNQWEEAKILLAPIRRRIEQYRTSLDPMLLIALYQMLGVSAAMLQDFDQAALWFRLALEICTQQPGAVPGSQAEERFFSAHGVSQIAAIEQNLALVHEWLERPGEAAQHWLRYLDALEKNFANSKPSDYLQRLAFECVHRMAEQAQKAEQWSDALERFQRAHRYRPTDYDTLEKLFNLYSQLRRPEEARKVLRRMREVRPNDPHVELFELDVHDLRTIDDVEKTLQDLRRVAQKFPGDSRVDDRTRAVLDQLLPRMEQFAEHFNGQVKKVVDQMRRLPSYQVNWSVVRDVMRDLEEGYSQLRRAAQRTMSFTAATEEHRRELRRLIAHCDRKIDQCASLSR